MAIMENAALQAEMTNRIKVILATESDYADFANNGYIENMGRNIESPANWATLTVEEQALWGELRRETELTTNPEDFLKAIDAVQTYLVGIAD